MDYDTFLTSFLKVGNHFDGKVTATLNITRDGDPIRAFAIDVEHGVRVTPTIEAHGPDLATGFLALRFPLDRKTLEDKGREQGRVMATETPSDLQGEARQVTHDNADDIVAWCAAHGVSAAPSWDGWVSAGEDIAQPKHFTGILFNEGILARPGQWVVIAGGAPVVLDQLAPLTRPAP